MSPVGQRKPSPSGFLGHREPFVTCPGAFIRADERHRSRGGPIRTRARIPSVGRGYKPGGWNGLRDPESHMPARIRGGASAPPRSAFEYVESTRRATFPCPSSTTCGSCRTLALSADLHITRQVGVISLCPGVSRLVPICPGHKAWGFGVGNQRDSAERIGSQLLGQSWDKSAIAGLMFWSS